MNNLDLLFVQPCGDNWAGENEKVGKFHGVGQSENTSDGYELAIMATVCKREGIKADYIVDRSENEEGLLRLIDRITAHNPKIVGIEAMTCYSSNAIYLAKKLKEKNDKIIIFTGGYHPSGYPEMLYDAKSVIDFAFIGAAEKTIVHVTKELLKGNKNVFSARKRAQLPRGRFDGSFSSAENDRLDKLVDSSVLAYLENDVIQLVPREKEDLFNNYDEIPIPERNIEAHDRVVCGVLSVPVPSKQKAATMVLTRGCPNSCSYCQSTNVFGTAAKKSFSDVSVKARSKSIGFVLQELEYLSNMGINFVFFTDLLTNSSGDYLKELSGAIVARKKEKKINPDLGFYCMFRPHTEEQQKRLGLDFDIYKYMKAMGVVRIGFGIEFLTDNKLENYNRNYKKSDVYKHLVATSDAGIFIRGLSMYGTPEDTVESFEQYADHMIQLPVDVWRLGPVTPYPGTKYGNENLRRVYKSLSLPKDFDNFDSNTLVLLPNDERLDKKTLLEIRKKVLKKVYNSDIWNQRIREKGEKFPELQDAINYFLSQLKDLGFIEEKKSWMFAINPLPESVPERACVIENDSSCV
jgi:radical SAM superfamily enzyme YgiQ (UPF0313 family)